MEPPTKKQQEVFEFFQTCALVGNPAPSIREICQEFGFRSPRSAADHVNALVRKGLLEQTRERRARNVRLKHPPSIGIPLLGSIPAGFPEVASEHALAKLPLPAKLFGISDPAKAFALIVRGDSMEKCYMLHGDTVILESGVEAITGSVVAAVIDAQCTLKTFLRDGTKTWLRAENPRYPDLLPAEGLHIQGVVRGVLRTTVSRQRH